MYVHARVCYVCTRECKHANSMCMYMICVLYEVCACVYIYYVYVFVCVHEDLYIIIIIIKCVHESVIYVFKKNDICLGNGVLIKI